MLPSADKKVAYTKNMRDEFYNMLRDILDELERFPRLMLLIGGSEIAVYDPRVGFPGHIPLWMRLQSGISGSKSGENPYADMYTLDSSRVIING